MPISYKQFQVLYARLTTLEEKVSALEVENHELKAKVATQTVKFEKLEEAVAYTQDAFQKNIQILQANFTEDLEKLHVLFTNNLDAMITDADRRIAELQQKLGLSQETVLGKEVPQEATKEALRIAQEAYKAPAPETPVTQASIHPVRSRSSSPGGKSN